MMGGEFLIIAASKNSGSFDSVSLLIVTIIAAISLAVIFYIRRKRKKVKPIINRSAYNKGWD